MLAVSFPAPVDGLAQRPAAANVQVQMRHIDFHVDSAIVLHIDYLRGELQPTSPDRSPDFDDKHSFVLGIDSARIGITPGGLGDLLNRYTFAYPGAPLRKLAITIENGRLKQQGEMRGISFSIVGDLSLTPEGELRLHPISTKAAGVGVGGLMKFFGIHLEKLVKLKEGRGVRIDGNDFLLSPTELLPPPRIKGRIVAVEVRDSEIVQVFRAASEVPVHPLAVPDPKAPNYMYYQGGVLRFGKLTMKRTDLLIIDAVPSDAFDFFLDQYNAQLVAGYSKNTASHGLIVVMQDYRRTPPLPGKASSPSSRVTGAVK
jgi:hypothetical protein